MLDAAGGAGTSEQNPIDVAWGQQRPVAPRAPVRVHPLSFAGETVASKLDKIKAKVRTASQPARSNTARAGG